MHRQSFNVVFIVVLLLSLTTSCGRGKQRSDTVFSVRMLTASKTSGRWDRAAERGLGRIASELEADVARVPNDGAADDRERLVEQGRAGISLVFCVGGCSETTLYSVASEFPNTVFVMLPGRARAENVAGVSFLPEEVGYLAGAVAGALNPDAQLGLLRGDGQPWLEEPLAAGEGQGWRGPRRRLGAQFGRSSALSLRG